MKPVSTSRGRSRVYNRLRHNGIGILWFSADEPCIQIKWDTEAPSVIVRWYPTLGLWGVRQNGKTTHLAQLEPRVRFACGIARDALVEAQ